jgi:predicted MFS family arabinose efflux permease
MADGIERMGVMASALPMTGSQVTLRLLPFTAIVLFGYLSIGIPLAILPAYVHDTLGYGPVTVGWVIAAQAIVTLLTRQFAGSVADTRSGKTAVVAGALACAGAALAYLCSALIGASPATRLVILLFGRAVLGVGESLLITGALSWCLLVVGHGFSGRALVWVGIAMYGAVAVGAPLGTALAAQHGFAAVAVAALLVPLMAAGLAAAMSAIPSTQGKRLGFHTVVARIWPYGLAATLSTFGFGVLFAFLGLDFASKGWTGASYGLTAFGGGYVSSRLLFGDYPDRFGGRAVTRVTVPAQVLALLTLWLATGEWIAFMGAFLLGASYSLTFPSLGVEALKRVPAQNRGAVMSALVAFSDIGIGVAGPVAGLVVELSGYASVFLAGAVAAGIALLAASRFPVTTR